MRIFLIIFSLLASGIFSRVQAQELGFGVDAGYSFKFINKPLNQLYLGAVVSTSKGTRGYSEYDNQLVFGAGSYFGSYGGKKQFIPAVSAAYGSATYLAKGTLTPYAVMPSIHLNFFNYGQLGLGYNIGYRKKNNVNMNGIVISFNINLDIIGHYIDIST